MNKLNVTVSAPYDTYSGYGARSRDIVKALVDTGKYNVKVLSQRWGNTRFGFLKDHNMEELASLTIKNLTEKPDIWIQITVPNEFQPVGKYNIGITAGIETTICHHSWLDGINRMDLNLVSSQHAKSVFESTVFTVDNNSLRCQKPVEVLFEGVDLGTYFKVKDREASPLVTNLDSIPESFCYLFVGHWLQGAYGEDRKNVGYMVRKFLDTFKNTKNPPALILKTQSATASVVDRHSMLEKINEVRKTVKGKLPNIYLLHGELSDKEINSLYNHPKVKSMISLTKGEGYGRPLLEFSTTGKPIIASGWSGHTDFLSAEMNYLVGGTLTNVHPSAVVENTILSESQWFTPSDTEVGKALKDVHKNHKKYLELAKRQAHRSRENFSYEKMVELLDTLLEKNLPKFASEVKLNIPTLPKLKKI